MAVETTAHQHIAVLIDFENVGVSAIQSPQIENKVRQQIDQAWSFVNKTLATQKQHDSSEVGSVL